MSPLRVKDQVAARPFGHPPFSSPTNGPSYCTWSGELLIVPEKPLPQLPVGRFTVLPVGDSAVIGHGSPERLDFFFATCLNFPFNSSDPPPALQTPPPLPWNFIP